MKFIISLISNLKKTKFGEVLFHSRNYLIGSVGTKAISFVSIPILTRILTAADYGTINVFSSYTSILSTVLTLNCYVAVGRYWYEKQTDFKKLFGTSIVFVSALLLCSFFGFLFFKENLARWLALPPGIVLFIVPLVYFFVFGSWYEQVLVPQKQSGKIATRNVALAICTLLMTIVLVVFIFKKDKYVGAITANLIVGMIFFAYYLVQLKPYYQFSFRIKDLQYILRYSLPLLPYSLSGLILLQVGRLMVNNKYGATDAGLFSLANNISMVHTFVVSSLYQAWMPDYFAYMGNGNRKDLTQAYTRIFNIILLTGLALILFGKELGALFSGKQFHSGLQLIPIFIIGLIFNAAFSIYAWDIQFVKKNIYLSVVVLLAGLLNIGLNMAFMPHWGYVSAAYTSTASYLFLVITTWLTTRFILKASSVSFLLITKLFIMFLPFAAAPFLIQGLTGNGVLCYIFKFICLSAFLFIAFRKEIKSLRFMHISPSSNP